MEMSNVDKITIPEGDVEQIHINNTLVWKKRHTYGVSWDKSSSSTMTRTDEAANFSSPTIGTGTTMGSSPFDDCFPWNEIKKVTDGNNTLVSIPRFYYKWTDSSNSLKLQITNRPADGFYTSPLHADRGDGKGEREVAYIGRYRCIESTYYSKSGTLPQTSITRATARSKVAALGTGYYQFDYAAFWTTRMLFLVEFATWDGSSTLNHTTTPTWAQCLTGNTDSMTYHTGVSENGYSIQYRWMEDLWTNCLEWCDGIYLSGSSVYGINNPTKFSDSTNGTLIGTLPSSYGYITDWTVPTISGYEYALFPKSADASVSGYIQDYIYFDAGTTVYIGGSRNMYNQHGPFFIYCDFTSTQTSSLIGTRLIKLL